MSEKNRLMRPEEVGRAFMESARKTIQEMPDSTVRKFAAMESAHPGINGAIAATLCLAARERLEAEAE